MRVSNLFHDPEVRAVVASKERDAEERLARLTRRQREILPLLCDGTLNKTVAHALGLSVRTIENQRLEIMDRTSCKTFAELIKLYALAG